MNPRELVLDSLARRTPKAIPFQLDLTEEVQTRLASHFNDPGFQDTLGNALAMENNALMETISPEHIRDLFGVVWSQTHNEDIGIVMGQVLPEPEIGSYRFPEPDGKSIRAKCERLAGKRERQFTMYVIGFSLFERAWTLRGMEDLLMDFMLNPDFVDDLLDRITAYNLAVVDIVAEYPIDCIFFGDDWGQQQGLIMGPAHWRRFIGPRLARMYAHVKSKGMYIAQHSCGDIHELFPDLVEMGLDIYNTFQPEIYNVAEMKRLYGNKITFYGGVSTQRLLPFATPEEVKTETRRLMALLGKGGGYIVAPTHAIPDDVPTENILAFLEAVQEQ
jgi:uroporphyrinogen decarboxylase